MVASYPAQIREFGTDKVDEVDIVYAAHVNLLQDEVEAVQANLGTNPHNPNTRSRSYTTVKALLTDLESRKYEDNDTIKASSGSITAPGLTFNADTSMGFYRDGAGLGVVSGGKRMLRLTAFTNYDEIASRELNEAIRFQHIADTVETVANGAVRFTVSSSGVTATGFVSGNDLRAAGVVVATDTQRLRANGGTGSGTPGFAFANDADTGMYRHGTDVLGFAAGGVARFLVDGDGARVSGKYLRGGTGTGTSNNNTLQPGLGFYQHTLVGFDSASNNEMNVIVGGHSTMTFYDDRTYSQDPLELSNHGRALRFRDAFNAGLQIRTSGSGGFSLMGGTATQGPFFVATVAGDGQTFGPGANNTVKLGSNGLEWKEVWANAYNGASDRRLKDDIIDTDLGLQWVLANRPRRFRWKAGGTRPHYGFIAQEVKATMEALGVHDFGGFVDPSIRTSDAVELTDDNAADEHFLALNMNEFIAPLYKAVQDLYELLNEDHETLAELVETQTQRHRELSRRVVALEEG